MKQKGFLLVLDPRSIAGQLYLSGDNDGTTPDGGVVCPMLFCTELTMDNPFGIHAKRPLKAPKSYQSIWLPYGSVAQIVDIGTELSTPFGFAPGTG